MKKFIAVPVFLMIMVQIFGQEQKISFIFPSNKDSVVINGKAYSWGTHALTVPPCKELIFEIDEGTVRDFGFRFSSGNTLIDSVGIDYFRNHHGTYRFLSPDSARNYTVAIRTNDKYIKADITLRSAPPGAGGTARRQEQQRPAEPAEPAAGNPVQVRDTYLPGIEYYDALKLAAPWELTQNEWDNIFRYYFDKPNYLHPDIVKRIRDANMNQYLADAIDILDEKGFYPEKKVEGSQSLASAVSSLSFSSIGGLDVTNIADGFAKFIVKRAKTELNIAFFDRFRELISKPEYQDMRTLFPNTYRSLMIIGAEIYNYDAYLQTLRESFEKDLAGLLTTMPEVIDNHPEFFEEQPELKALLKSAFYIGQEFQDRQNPGEIIANYPDEVWKDCNPNYRASFQALKLFSASLRKRNSQEAYWINADAFKALASNPKAMKIYFGLLIESSRKEKITFSIKGSPDSLADIINRSWTAAGKNLPEYTGFVRSFIQKSSMVVKKMEGLKKVSGDSLLLENYYSFFSSVIDLLKFSAKVEELPGFPKMGLKEKTALYLDAAQTTSDIVIDVNRRNYSSAVVNLIHLYSMVFSDRNTEKELAETKSKVCCQAASYDQDVKILKSYQKELKKEKDPGKKIVLNTRISAFESMMDTTYAAYLQYLRLDKMKDVLAAIYKYGTFMSTVVAAKTSDEVAEAIEAAALPAGSSRIKKETKFNVCLNSYLGMFVGYEQIRGFDTSGFRFNSYGVTAPIGVAISKGHSLFFINTNDHGWSTSAFFSFIDIGAVAAFRVKDSTTSQIPTIHLQDIISPGVFLAIGFPKFPVSFNFGIQMGPNLRSVDYNGNDYSDNIYIRYSASLVVDIPIFNFYSKSR